MAADATFVKSPFTVLIDSNESQPWTFQGLTADADRGRLPLVVPVQFASLGRYPNSRGDYSIAGLANRVAIERKSAEDAIGTFLGFDSQFHAEKGLHGRRERFIRELQNLAAMECAIVIVEASMESILQMMPGCDGEDYFNPATGEIPATRGVRSVLDNRKSFYRSVVSWRQRPELKVQWEFASSRRAAECFAYRWLEFYWKHLPKAERAAASERAAMGMMGAA